MSAAPPLPNVDYLEHKAFWEATRNRRIEVQKCAQCGSLRFPPRPSCTRCGSMEHAWVEVAGKGTLFSWTVTHVAMHPAFASAVPYAVGVVELSGGEGVRMLGRVVNADPAQLRTGMALRAVFEPSTDERVVLVNWEPDRDAVGA